MIILNLPTETIVYLLIVLTSSLIVITLYFFIYHFIVKAHKKDSARLQNKVYKEALQLLDDARHKSIEIITESQHEASKIIDEVTRLEDLTEQEIKRHLKEVTDKHHEKLDSLTNRLALDYDGLIKADKKLFENKVEKLDNALDKKLDEMSSFMSSVISKSQKDIAAKTSALYKTVNDEVSEYKTERIKEINRAGEAAAKDFMEKYLKTNITHVQHQEIVSTLLDEAIRSANANPSN